jgi:chromosome segregation ATPase
MYAALTNSAAMENPDYGLGPRKETTNFQRLHRRSDTTDSAVAVINTRLGEQAAVDTAHAKSLEVILERLATIDRNIQDLNNTVTEKFKSVDKLLTEYDGRITGVENRMKTVEVDLDSFRTEFVGYRQRVTNIETLLRRYDLAVMHNDINVLRDITTNHEERILDLTGKVQINTSEILVTKSNLIEAEQELSGVSAEVGGLKVGVAEIFTRLDNCNCR